MEAPLDSRFSTEIRASVNHLGTAFCAINKQARLTADHVRFKLTD